MPIHTAGAWESDRGTLLVESSRVHDNAFPFFPTEDGEMPSPQTKADFVRWEFDLTQPNGTMVPDPYVVMDLPSEFPRIDERYVTKQYEWLFLNVFIPENLDGSKNIFQGLNGLAMHSNKTNKTRFFHAGDDSLCQEPIFIPRSKDAAEGDGWIMTLVERRGANRCDIVVLDTQAFEAPIAIVQLPLHMKAQIHGNWVSAAELPVRKSLARQIDVGPISGKGALEPML